MKIRKDIFKFFYLIGILVQSIFTDAQPTIHSHNDYFLKLPLYTALSSGANSIEIDVIYQYGKLNVAHDLRDLPTSKTIEVLYFLPLVELSKNPKVSLEKIQIMIDIKNEPQALLSELMKIIDKIPEFKSLLLNNKIKPIVISGNKPSSYLGWPEYILFDHQSLENLSKVPMEKVAFFSFSFLSFSKYNGKGKLIAEDEAKLNDAIDKVHFLNKKIRFWASPDTKSMWYTLYNLGADYINTDKPWECSSYINGLALNRVQRDLSQKSSQPQVTNTKK
jgi:alkaline phosphatase